jgi:hypothetical protein
MLLGYLFISVTKPVEFWYLPTLALITGEGEVHVK